MSMMRSSKRHSCCTAKTLQDELNFTCKVLYSGKRHIRYRKKMKTVKTTCKIYNDNELCGSKYPVPRRLLMQQENIPVIWSTRKR
jgi:hypothetical protein